MSRSRESDIFPIAANPGGTAHALVPWTGEALLFNHSIKAYGRDFKGNDARFKKVERGRFGLGKVS